MPTKIVHLPKDVKERIESFWKDDVQHAAK